MFLTNRRLLPDAVLLRTALIAHAVEHRLVQHMHIVPVSLNQLLSALAAVRVLVSVRVHVAHVDVLQTHLSANGIRSLQCRLWSAALVRHLVVRVERRNVPRNRRLDVVQKLDNLRQLLIGVVFIRNDQRRDLHPESQLHGVFDAVLHEIDIAAAELAVELAVPRLQIDVERVDIWLDVLKVFLRHVAICHIHALQSLLVRQLRDIMCVLSPNRGLVVGEGNTLAPLPNRHVDESLG